MAGFRGRNTATYNGAFNGPYAMNQSTPQVHSADRSMHMIGFKFAAPLEEHKPNGDHPAIIGTTRIRSKIGSRKRHVKLRNCERAKVGYRVMEIALVVDRLFASQQLKKNNSVAVYIRLLIETGGARILGIDI